MEFNLQTFPKGWGKIGQGKCGYCQDFHRWKEGFEKQLLADLATNVDLTDKEIQEFLYHEDDKGDILSLGMEQGRRKVLKQILGEC